MDSPHPTSHPWSSVTLPSDLAHQQYTSLFYLFTAVSKQHDMESRRDVDVRRSQIPGPMTFTKLPKWAEQPYKAMLLLVSGARPFPEARRSTLAPLK